MSEETTNKLIEIDSALNEVENDSTEKRVKASISTIRKELSLIIQKNK